MAAQSEESPFLPQDQPNSGWGIDDEIELRKYLQVLIDWGRDILFFAMVTAAIAALIVLTLRSMETPQYIASSTIAIARIQSDITFDERYRTLSDQDISFQQSNSNSRRAALLGLVYSGGIAQSVIDELGNSLNEAESIAANLLNSIEANIVAGQNARTESDLIRITATADSPEKAALIANSWAKHYVDQVNTLYGQVPVEVSESVNSELTVAQANYEVAQGNLEAFMADNQVNKFQRLIDEKQAIIDTLQSGKQTAIATIVEEELNARRQVISAYINSLSSNRLLAFNKEQQAKRELLSAYIDAEVESRLLAIAQDREARQKFFNLVANAQISSTTTVFDQQVQAQIDHLSRLYTEQGQIQRLLERALVLRTQIETSAEAATTSNAVALTLLKSQIFMLVNGLEDESTLTNTMTGGIQLNLDVTPPARVNAEDQQVDINTLVDALRTYLATLNTEIETHSQQILAGDNYQFLDQLMATELGVSTAMTESLTLLAEDPNSITEVNNLSNAVVQRYVDLFGVGGLAEQNQELIADSALLAQIEILYPDLFELGTLSELTENVSTDNPLALISVEKAQELLQLQGLEDIPSYTAAAEPLIQAIDQLESEIQALEAQLESESSRRRQLVQQRDLAWDAYNTLSNKATELSLAQSATNSEVRLAAPAVPPVEPLPGISLIFSTAIAGIIGLMMGVFIAFLANFMGKEPFLRRREQAPA